MSVIVDQRVLPSHEQVLEAHEPPSFHSIQYLLELTRQEGLVELLTLLHQRDR